MATPAPTPPPSHDESDRTITSIDSATERWRTALESSSNPSLDDFLPPPGDSQRREALVALISVELEVRIRRNELCRVEPFVAKYGELQSSDVWRLILAELRARQNRGEVIKKREYAERFPHQQESLRQLTSSTGSTVSRSKQRRPQTLRPGQSLGDYEILSRLGAGSYADVYLARQKSLGRNVALKVSLGSRQEGRTLAKLDHPNIVQVLSEHTVAGHQLLVMRFVPGKTLDQWLQYRESMRHAVSQGRHLLSWLRSDGEPSDRARDDREHDIRDKRLTDIAAYLFLDLAKALAHAHERGVLHLDIKPSNILLDMDGRGLLMDFNVAAMPDENGIQGAQPSGGTLAYMPPEQLGYFAEETSTAPRQIDTRSDLYSLGVVMYAFVSGASPWPIPDEGDDETLARQLIAQRMAPSTPLSKVSPTVSPGLASMVDRLLATDQDERYPSAAVLVDDLKNWFSKRPLTVAQAGVRERIGNWCIRNRVPLVTAAMLFGGIGLYGLGQRSQLGSSSKPEMVAAAREPGPPKSSAPQPKQSDDAPTALPDLRRQRAVVDVIRPRKRFPLRFHLQRAARTSIDDWELSLNPLALYGVDLEDDWEQKYFILRRLSDAKRQVVDDAVTEVLLVQLVAHGREQDEKLERRFFRRLPQRHQALDLIRYLERQLATRSIDDVSTSSMIAAAETEFEWYLMAVVAAVRHEYDAALTLFQKSMRENSRRHTTAYYYGLCAERANRTQDAFRAYRRCIEERPHFVPAYLSLASLHARQHETEEAIQQLEAAREVSQSPDSIMRIASLLQRLEQPQKALATLTYLLDKLGRRTPLALTKRASIKLQLGDRSGAEADLEAALELDPSFREARHRLKEIVGKETVETD